MFERHSNGKDACNCWRPWDYFYEALWRAFSHLYSPIATSCSKFASRRQISHFGQEFESAKHISVFLTIVGEPGVRNQVLSVRDRVAKNLRTVQPSFGINASIERCEKSGNQSVQNCFSSAKMSTHIEPSILENNRFLCTWSDQQTISNSWP